MKVSFNWRAINYWRGVHGAPPIRERRWPALIVGALIAALILFALSLSACAMAPNSLRPEIEHMSHLSQHFGADTDYGANMANLVAHWDLQPHVYFELSEGIDVSHHWQSVNSNGEIIGPREQFSARLGYIFTVRP